MSKKKQNKQPSTIFYVDDVLPEKMRTGADNEYTIEVGVIVEGRHLSGYYEPQRGRWWVNYGGISVGHRHTDSYEIEGWYYFD